MSTGAEVQTTNVVKYYNGNGTPLSLFISHLNITLKLGPGEALLDRQGRFINDPFFDHYKQLAKAISDAPVPLIRVPQAKALVPYARDGMAVRQVTEFTTNQYGLREPVMPKSVQSLTVPVNSNSVIPMTMQEARARGFVRNTRTVPEDFGAPETDGAPKSGKEIPQIKYAVDTPRPAEVIKPVPALPPGAATLSDDSRTLKTAEARTQLQEALIEGQKVADDLESESGFMNVVVPNHPLSATVAAKLPAPALPEPDPETEGAASEAEFAAESAEMPEPSLEESEPETEIEESYVPAPPAQKPPVRVVPAQVAKPIAQTAKPAPRPLPQKQRFVCNVDKKAFDSRAQLVEYVKKHHPQALKSTLTTYPEPRA